MARPLSIFFLSSVLALATLHGIHAVEYIVTNRAPTTPGGIKFNNQLGVEYTKQTMASASDFIWRLFQQNTEADRKNVPLVSLFLDDLGDNAVAGTSNNEISVGDNFIQNIQGDVKPDFNGVVYHEMTHVWQWDGSAGNKAPGHVIEGIADFVRLKANYVPQGWAQPGDGSNWNDSYSVTARFFDYCNDLRNGFVADLNKQMRETYSDEFFVQLLGKPVDQLWNEYKARYGKN
ncbi:uncharacterized protein LOC110619503 [Manihot esculenta]|uniref:Basic secretory protease n=1 Tax=Manihot esculenta TaxID=3983 RepID=A0A2C9VJ97_MANES|nr:uncharacterized protein LOC110619503 [Manihot esculenta]OAY45562.1 hypothetical protein MANES_07G071700v8 [Manihot esculenta]